MVIAAIQDQEAVAKDDLAGDRHTFGPDGHGDIDERVLHTARFAGRKAWVLLLRNEAARAAPYRGAASGGVEAQDHVLAAHLQGEAVLLDLETKRYYRLNETAARIWKGLEQSLAPDQITDILVAEFDVDPVTARAELDRALEDLRARGLVT